MKFIRFCFIFFSSFLVAGACIAQTMDYKSEEPTDFMRSNGKIFVVMAVVLIIVIGLIIYLITLDRKIARLEKKP